MGKRRAAVVCTILLSIVGCGTTWRHVSTLDDYEGQVLPVPGPGATRLEIESEYDVSVRNMLATHGDPDYILVESLDLLKLIYLDDDRVLVVDRSESFTGAVSIMEPIPDDISVYLARGDRDRLTVARTQEIPRSTQPTPASKPLVKFSPKPTPRKKPTARPTMRPPQATRPVRTSPPTRKPTSKPQTQSPASRPSLDQRVYIDVKIDLASSRRPAIRGETNLPDGTVLMTSVEGKGSGFYGQDRARVRNGRFSSGPFGPSSGLAPGEYEADVTMPFPRLQDASVRAVIGERGEKLKGKLVRPDTLGATVSTVKVFRVGNTTERAAAKRDLARNKKKARAILRDLTTLAKVGRGMQPLRNPNDLEALRECGNQMRENQAKVWSLRSRAEALPRSIGAHLAAAAISMDSCVSCRQDAIESCDVADSDLREAAAALR